MQCQEINPSGQKCTLVAGHAGVHQVATSAGWAAPGTAAKPKGRGAGWWLRTAAIVVVALVVIGAISSASKGAPGAPTGTDRPVAAAPTSGRSTASTTAAPTAVVTAAPVAAAFEDIVLKGKGKKVVKFAIQQVERQVVFDGCTFVPGPHAKAILQVGALIPTA